MATSRPADTTEVTGVARFERFFREAAGLDVDKQDLRRYVEFISQRVHKALVRAVGIAKANGRDIILPPDLPITAGLQERMHEFRQIDRDVGLRSILERLVPHPVMELDYGDDTEQWLTDVAGAYSVALARSFRIVGPELRNPQTGHWERAFALFDLVT
jgi:hypothetical protein